MNKALAYTSIHIRLPELSSVFVYRGFGESIFVREILEGFAGVFAYDGVCGIEAEEKRRNAAAQPNFPLYAFVLKHQMLG